MLNLIPHRKVERETVVLVLCLASSKACSFAKLSVAAPIVPDGALLVLLF